MDNVKEITELLQLYDALINHPFANLREAALNKLWELDKEAAKLLEAEKKKAETDAAAKKGK